MITRTKARGFPARPARIARRGAFASALAVALLLLPPETLAQGEFWSFQIGAARSDVSIGERDVTWGTDRAQLTYQNPTTGGFYIAFEVQRRDRLVEIEFPGHIADLMESASVYFKPEPVLKSTTVSSRSSQPCSRSFSVATRQAAPSGAA